MLRIGVQSQNVVYDGDPDAGFKMLKNAGFDCCDFSLNTYLINTDLYNFRLNDFFDKTEKELEEYFTPHKIAAEKNKIEINQMHMPYPVYVPYGGSEINDYLQNNVALKSLKICEFFNCRHIVVHGFKLAQRAGSEEAEWEYTERFLSKTAQLAKELKIIICLENLYNGIGGHIVEGPCCNAKKAAERIDRLNERFGAEVFGFCFDTGHANLVGIDFENFITALGKRLKVLHIHDNDGIGDLHQLPFTFTKIRENTCCTDWNSFIKGMKNIRFDGVLSFETAPVLKSFPFELKPHALNFIADTGKYFASEIMGG